MAYRIYYGDGTVSENEIAQARGIQVIVQDHPSVGVELVTSGDYYVRRGEYWHAVDIFGLFDYLMDSGLVLFGRTIGREEYQEVMRQALKDKAGWLPGERRG